MDEFLRLGFNIGGDETAMTSIFHAMFAMLASFVLSLVVAYVYRVTHSGVSYSQSLVKTFVMMAVIVSVVMIVIGSNIARAFSLVGALSIIRFRTAVKDSIDVSYIFLTMAIGMACGTGFYGIAFMLTALMSAMIYFMYRFDVGAHSQAEMVLKVQLPEDQDPEKAFAEVFYRLLRNYSLLTAESLEPGVTDLVFSVEMKRNVTTQDLILELRKLASGGRVQIITGLSNVNI